MSIVSYKHDAKFYFKIFVKGLKSVETIHLLIFQHVRALIINIKALKYIDVISWT